MLHFLEGACIREDAGPFFFRGGGLAGPSPSSSPSLVTKGASVDGVYAGQLGVSIASGSGEVACDPLVLLLPARGYSQQVSRRSSHDLEITERCAQAP
jgi:hypothetical protein